MEQILRWWLSCLRGASQGIQHLLHAGPAAHLDLPCATTGTGADEVTSLAQSLGQCGEQGLARDRATRPGWEAHGELGAARVALAWQRGDQTPRVRKGGIPKPPAWCPSAQQPLAMSRSIMLEASMPWNAPWQQDSPCPRPQHTWDLLTISPLGPSDPPRMIPPLGAGRGQAGDEQCTTGCCACGAGAGAHPTARCSSHSSAPAVCAPNTRGARC